MKKKFNKTKKAPKMMAARETPKRETPPQADRRSDVMHDAARKAGIFLPDPRRRP